MAAAKDTATTARARVYDMDPDALFHATLESIRRRPRLEVVDVDTDGARIHVRERRRFPGRARDHRVVLNEEGHQVHLQVEAQTRAARSRRPARHDEIEAFLQVLGRRVDRVPAERE